MAQKNSKYRNIIFFDAAAIMKVDLKRDQKYILTKIEIEQKNIA